MDRLFISEGDKFLWLSRGDLNGETESAITTAQDQVLQTEYLAAKNTTNRNR
jgi:hypothetical protein